MSNMNLDLLRRDECQPLTPEQIADIKSQITKRPKANVNIVPYEIYDEDEHIVGEWRETISGVKKKKPVYEKTMPITTPNASGYVEIPLSLSNISNVFLSDGSYISVPLAGGGSQNIPINSAGTTTLLQINSSNILSCIMNISDTNWRNRNTNLIIRYTKTTDEWEEV